MYRNEIQLNSHICYHTFIKRIAITQLTLMEFIVLWHVYHIYIIIKFTHTENYTRIKKINLHMFVYIYIT